MQFVAYHGVVNTGQMEALLSRTSTKLICGGLIMQKIHGLSLFEDDDDNGLFTMCGLPTTASWQGDHTQIVVAAMAVVWQRYRSILKADHSRTEYRSEYTLNPLLQVYKYQFDDPEKEKLRNRYALKILLEQNPDSFKGVRLTCEATIIKVERYWRVDGSAHERKNRTWTGRIRSYSPRYSPRGRRSPPPRHSISPLRRGRSYSRSPPPYRRARRDSPYGNGGKMESSSSHGALEALTESRSKKGMAAAGKVNTTPLEDKDADGETFIYETKLVVVKESKNGSLLFVLKEIEKSMLRNTEDYGSFKSKLNTLPRNVVVIAPHTQLDSRKEKVRSGHFKFLSLIRRVSIHLGAVDISFGRLHDKSKDTLKMMKQLTRAFPKQIDFTPQVLNRVDLDCSITLTLYSKKIKHWRGESYTIGFESSFMQTGAFVNDAKDVLSNERYWRVDGSAHERKHRIWPSRIRISKEKRKKKLFCGPTNAESANVNEPLYSQMFGLNWPNKRVINGSWKVSIIVQSDSKNELKDAQGNLKHAFIEFYEKLRYVRIKMTMVYKHVASSSSYVFRNNEMRALQLS
ncbi:hypothetical protein Tco_0000445 [Tanacetum coccineum]